MQIDSDAFQALDLRAHAFLHDVPLHDAWRVDLGPRDGDPDVRTVREILETEVFSSINPVARALFGLRAFLGKLFKWDDEPVDLPSKSFESRLTTDDRQRSLEAAGKAHGPFRVLYVFPGEALSEVVNKTVHAFLCTALVPTAGGYSFYWATYVRPVGPLTRVYMAVIDPFRRWIVYPSILRRLERAWNA